MPYIPQKIYFDLPIFGLASKSEWFWFLEHYLTRGRAAGIVPTQLRQKFSVGMWGKSYYVPIVKREHDRPVGKGCAHAPLPQEPDGILKPEILSVATIS